MKIEMVTSVTQRSLKIAKLCSRYFAPWVGIPEDPVTGSAHTVLTPYWAQALGGKNELFARQSSPRGGELKLELKSDHIAIRGQVTIVLRGSITV